MWNDVRILSHVLTEYWNECKVVEGACTVDCGGPKRLVCDTGPWPTEGPDVFWGHLHVKVQVTRDKDVHTVIKEYAFRYRRPHDSRNPKLQLVTPRAAAAGDAITLRGTSFGGSIKDYLNIYIGKGTPPAGGNLNSIPSHAVCRPEDLNLQADAVTGIVSSSSSIVMNGRAETQLAPIQVGRQVIGSLKGYSQ